MKTPNMQVVRVEEPRTLERKHVRKCEPVPIQDNQVPSAEFLDRAIDMNRRELRCCGNVVLRKWEIA